MYVYVTKFEGNPSLIKIGRSVCPTVRNDSLAKSHGSVVYSDHYKIGPDYTSVETYLHNKYSKYNERISGDGGTEFFCDEIYKDVTNYLNTFRTEDYKLTDKDFISAQLKVERKRYYDLIGKLLGYKYSDLHDGSNHSLYTGYWDIMKIIGCYSMGFSTDEIHQRYLDTKEPSNNTRFTTPNRVGIAYRLEKYGTAKARNLEKLLVKAIERDENLLQ